MGLDFRDGSYRRYVTVGKRTVKDGEAVAIWNRSGVHREVIGPALVFLYCSSIRFLDKYTAGPEEYLVVKKTDGREEHVPGPISIFHNPTRHIKIEVKPAISLKSMAECVIFHRQLPPALVKTEDGFINPTFERQQIDRLIFRGPTLIFPGVGDTVHSFKWTGPLVSSVENSSFHVLNTGKRQFKTAGKVAFRGENKIKGTVQLSLSMQITDVACMVDNTSNLPADLYEALIVDLNQISLVTIETVQEVNDLDIFSTLKSFPQLTRRACEIGVLVDHILFGGFLPDESLCHHIAEMANVHAKHAKDCIIMEQNQQRATMELTAKKDQLAQQEIFFEAELKMKQQHLDSEQYFKQSELENKLKLQKQQEEFELQITRDKNRESICTLQSLSDIGVDLTKLLCHYKPESSTTLGLCMPQQL